AGPGLRTAARARPPRRGAGDAVAAGTVRDMSGADVPEGIAAVVVTHESTSTIDDCLARVRAADAVAEIRVIDIASTDDTLAVVQRHALADPRLRFIANPDNPGFGAACNLGVAESSAPWIAFVNPDCMVEPDTLSRLVAHA